MLKKIIIAIICLFVLLITGLGIYIYMLDWNQHKAIVEQRLSQITGLNAVIQGNLKVDLLPSPKFSANQIRFSAKKALKEPLVQINSVSANLDLMALLHHKFILSSMHLNGTTINVIKDENGISNWDGVVATDKNTSGNVKVSFNDVHFSGATFNYKNLKNNQQLEIPNISGFISAPSLQGPYKTNGKFIYNNSELIFNGQIVKNNDINVNLLFGNAATASKVTLNGTIGDKAKGSLTADSSNLAAMMRIIFGEKSIPEHYDSSFYLSFKYDYTDHDIMLDNFNVAYGADTKGSGSVSIKQQDIAANLDMTALNLDVLETVLADILTYAKQNKTFSGIPLLHYNTSVNLKSAHGLYRHAEAQNIALIFNLSDRAIQLSRFNAEFPGSTMLKSNGIINLGDTIDYRLENSFKTADLRVFASLFDIDLAKFSSEDDKKTIFKKGEATFVLNGDLDNVKVTIPQAIVDATELQGNLGFITSKKPLYVVADIKSSKILFDKYIKPFSSDVQSVSLEEKLIHQFKHIFWNHDINVDARVYVSSAVYNNVALEKMLLEFQSYQDKLIIKDFSASSLAGAALNLKADMKNIYKAPYFNELSYDVKTDNFPLFASALGIPTGDKKLFQRKLFAAQGALSGDLKNFSLSSVQKFGDTEFSYTGTIVDHNKDIVFDGDLELKTNNFINFVKALNLDYHPDLPVTAFTLSGQIKGSYDDFLLNNASAYLGANHIAGQLQFENKAALPKVTATLDFDKFDADRWLGIEKKNLYKPSLAENIAFLAKPDIDTQKIDYDAMKKLNFKMQLASQQLIFKGKNYASALLNATLNDGLLDVQNFIAHDHDTLISLSFKLNSHNVPDINGKYELKSMPFSGIGGNTYAIGPGILTAQGHFKSLATSAQDFIENLTSQGDFSYTDTSIKGWDLDIIKFELEQRKNTDGFEESIHRSLQSGQSNFNKIAGKYNISNGLLVSDSVVFESPVANVGMTLDLNLNSWLFTAVFEAVYHNASFLDVLKFSFDGHLDTPQVKVDLKESIQRIHQTELRLKEAQEAQQKRQQEKRAAKVSQIKSQLEQELAYVTQLQADAQKFKPQTNNESVNHLYRMNLNTLQKSEKKLARMLKIAAHQPDEKTLIDMGAELNVLKSKLKFIPKSLEDNYIVDGKYIFDNLFNKITWVYNVAHNNSTYYNSVAKVYLEQVNNLSVADTAPLNNHLKQQMLYDHQAVLDDMDKITTLYDKMRENYLSIVDAAKISEMQENNDLTNQALHTLLTYTTRMDSKIIKSLDAFRDLLKITTREDDRYMVYPPADPTLIDINSPTSTDGKPLPSKPNKIAETTSSLSLESDLSKKKDLDSLNAQDSSAKILTVLQQAPLANPENQDLQIASLLNFGGIASLIDTIAIPDKIAEKRTAENLTTLSVQSNAPEASEIATQKSPLADFERKAIDVDTQKNIRTFFKNLNRFEIAADTLLSKQQRLSDNAPTHIQTFYPDLPQQMAPSTVSQPVAMPVSLLNKKNSLPIIAKDMSQQELSQKSGFKKAVSSSVVSLAHIEPLPVSVESSHILPKAEPLSSSLLQANSAAAKIHFSGLLGKSMLRDKSAVMPAVASPHEYLFVTNQAKNIVFNGKILKSDSLYGK